MIAEIGQFQVQAVRDLAWLLLSPPMMKNPAAGEALLVGPRWGQGQWERHRALLAGWDAAPEALHDWLEPYAMGRLGFYFERLLAWWLEHCPEFQPLGHSIQVNEGKQTIGEMDFVFYDRREQLVFHWEISVKYYLAYRNSNGELDWYGPNSRDRLSLKYATLRDKQVRLSQHPAAQPVLAGLGAPAAVGRIFLKGYLFYPLSAWDSREEVFPETANPFHLTGWWIYAHELDQLFLDPDRRWMQLHKPDWLAPQVKVHPSQLKSPDFVRSLLSRQFERGKRDVFLAELAVDGHGEWSEVSRGFVVKDNWP